MTQAIKSRLYIAVTAVMLALSVGIALPAASVHAADPDPRNNLCSGSEQLSIDGGGSCANTSGADADINTLIANIINIFSLIVGIIAVIMIIVGGFKYITSGGDSNNITSAKHTIMYAIIGLIIVALAQVIVRFVLNKSANAVTGA